MRRISVRISSFWGKQSIRLSAGCNDPGACPDPHILKLADQYGLPVVLCSFLLRTLPKGSGSFALSFQSKQGTGHPLVEHHGQKGNGDALYQIQRRYAEHYKGSHIMNTAVDLGTHADDRLQGQAVKLGELGQQIDGIEGRTENGHHQGTQGQADHRAVLALVYMVPDSGGKDEAAAHHEIGEVANKGGGGAFEEQFQQNFDTLGGNGSAGS